ncbi:MAG TPA: hypothetical protein VG710_12410 [Opitutus sp.]|nr:hypothetical protein [Opitutus sp.]
MPPHLVGHKKPIPLDLSLAGSALVSISPSLAPEIYAQQHGIEVEPFSPRK